MQELSKSRVQNKNFLSKSHISFKVTSTSKPELCTLVASTDLISKELPHIWATFERKFVAMTSYNYPNLVTLQAK